MILRNVSFRARSITHHKAIMLENTVLDGILSRPKLSVWDGVSKPAPYTLGVMGALPWVGLGLYIANLMLGVGVQFRLVSTKRWHWVHHALYAVVFAGALAATLGLVLSGARWWPLALTLGALAVLPRYKGGSRPHMMLAVLGFVGYALALV
jgi:hypothetical protein